MIITEVSLIAGADTARYCWASLRRFQNVAFVEEMLVDLHSLPRKHRKNVVKQAQQIRYCLHQAKEYHDAASAVGLATKPLLLYYSIMSLALAEILLKQSGDSSLDKARGEHKHHGLSLSACVIKPDMPLRQSTSYLSAERLIKTGVGFGTFELWHRSARHVPIVGDIKVSYPGRYTQNGPNVIFRPSDSRLPLFDRFTLLDCYKFLPDMRDFLRQRKMESLCARGTVSQETGVNQFGVNKTAYQINIHQTDQTTIDCLMEEFRFEERAIENLKIIEPNGGLLVNVSYAVDQPVRFSSPDGVSLNAETTHFWAGAPPLNEFGFYYIALYILGNYARYFPDRWMVDVECSSELALSVEELVYSAERRVPLLALSEMGRSLLIIA